MRQSDGVLLKEVTVRVFEVSFNRGFTDSVFAVDLYSSVVWMRNIRCLHQSNIPHHVHMYIQYVFVPAYPPFSHICSCTFIGCNLLPPLKSHYRTADVCLW